MALESVFANPPPLVGVGNKEIHDGEKESEEQYSDQSDGEGPPILQPADTEVGEIEEGEIIDSGDDEPPIIETGESGLPVGDFKHTEESATEGETTSVKRKKKKKKKRRKPGSQDEDSADQGLSGDEKPKKPKRKKYVDHDRVHEEEHWYLKRSPDYDSRSPLGPYDSPPYDSPYEDDIDDRFGDGPDQNGRYKKKRGLMHGGPDKKRMRGGGQRRGHRMGPRREMRRPLCKFFLDGKCTKGADCNFIHDGKPPRKSEICKFYLNGFCSKGDNCMFMHKEFPCKFFHTGAKCYSADKCKFSHEPLSDDGRRLLDKHLEIFHDDEPGNSHGNIGSPTKQLPPPPPPPSSQQRPSLLGSPPRHIKEMAENYKKIPSLFEIHVGVPNPGMPLASPPHPPPPQSGAPVRPNFYTDTIKMSPTRPPLLPMPPPGFPPVNRVHFSPPGEKEPSPPPPSMHNLRMDDHSPLRMEADPSIEMNMEPIENNRPKVDIRRISEDDDNNDLRFEEDSDKLREKGNSSESESEGKKVSPSIAIPSHLPKKQRELFLRIQQQQREADSSQEESDKNAKKEDEENEMEENWYSSDDDEEDGDQPLTAMLKKLQQQPPQSKVPQPPASSSSQPVFDIASMLSRIRNEAANKPSTAKTENRDPRLSQQDSALETREVRNEIRDPRMRRDPRLEQNRELRSDPSRGDRDMRLEFAPKRDLKDSKVVEQKRDPRKDRDFRQINCEPPDMRSQLREVKSLEHDIGQGVGVHKTNAEARSPFSVPYRLHTVSVSHPNYGNLPLLGHNDPRLQNDPRLRRQSSIEMPGAVRQNQNNNHPCDNDNKPSELRTKKQESNHNGFPSEPHPVPNLTTASTRVDPRVNGPARADPRINRADPRTARLASNSSAGVSTPSEPSASTANALGKHLGLPGVPPSRERSVVPKNEVRSQDPRLSKRTENKTPENAKDELPSNKDSEFQPASKLKGGSFQRKSSLDYASPLGYHDSDSSSQGGYSNYNRRPQQRTLAVSSASQPPPTIQNSVAPLSGGEPKEPVDIPSLDIDETYDDSLSNTSLKEVFKTIDPTASPFC